MRFICLPVFHFRQCCDENLRYGDIFVCFLIDIVTRDTWDDDREVVKLKRPMIPIVSFIIYDPIRPISCRVPIIRLSRLEYITVLYKREILEMSIMGFERDNSKN